MKKRLFAVLMAMTMLTGCGSDSDISTVKNSEASPGTVTTTAEHTMTDYSTPEMKGEISISTIDEWDVLDEAAGLFMEKYPDVTVKVNSFRTIEVTEMENGLIIASSGGNAGESDEDYINLLTLRSL